MNAQCSSDDCKECALRLHYGEKYAPSLRPLLGTLDEIVQTRDKQALNYIANFVHQLLAVAAMYISTSTGGIH